MSALQVARGERVLLRTSPDHLAPLTPLVRQALEARGAVVSVLPYGPAADFESRLAQTDIYVWLPAPGAATPLDQGLALQRWLDNGPGRELHFHWIDGTRHADGLPAPHTPAYDRVYVDALDIDYRQLTAQLDRAIARLRAGEVRVTTAHGTDIRFRVGDRPFNKQDGNASKERARAGRIRIDRHIELPAGILRVAPIEESVTGVIVVPTARCGAESCDGCFSRTRLSVSELMSSCRLAGCGRSPIHMKRCQTPHTSTAATSSMDGAARSYVEFLYAAS